ncbi:hypothetical protein EV11_1173 [Prochlorococcus sp. SS52]|nr:hypothetical protein EV04_0553 [Prochlorococcus marinus str. LG]KGG19201.1 hypothetical protein EV08_1688 [Prochlorococcus marinus str. SS2]KGG25164.1 hypothetical protein EV09_0058 [Prochlorococcus marinus str. SS35]KGG33284.1 hypothetical protein EV10_0491 [Prochlorococcus marinus str. SS51]KGG35609.1 hypothetical protein EV11_1173 [Prochlorococcus sp. SS52]
MVQPKSWEQRCINAAIQSQKGGDPENNLTKKYSTCFV